MKIAAVTDDGVSIHSHFGQALYFEVLTVGEGLITARERRAKPAHNGHQAHGAASVHMHETNGAAPVHAPAMADVIGDCQILLARGMGEPAFNALQARGINPMLVQEHTIDEAVQSYTQGSLQHRPERMHHH